MTEIYFHPKYSEKFKELEELTPVQDVVLKNFAEFEGRMRLPDLYGKTVRVNERQFPEIWQVVKKVSDAAEITPPKTFLYEDFYYGVEAKGFKSARLEISAKTVEDLPPKALIFLIAREICRIKWKMHVTATAMEQIIAAAEDGNSFANIIPGIGTISKGLQITFAAWSRLSHYTADNFGYLVIRDVEVCVRAILALILNNVKLAENINVKEYLKQMTDIYLMDDLVARFSQNDEIIPYGPLRVKNLLAFATREDVINFKEVI